jgi:Aspartyl protease
MKIPPVMWTRTLARLLVLMGLLVAPLHVRAQEGVEFSSSDAHAVSVHAGNGIELQAQFNGQGPIDLIFDTGSANIMSASLAKKLGLTVAGTGRLDGGGGSVPAKGAMVDRVQIGGVTLRHQLFIVIDAPSGQVDDFAFVGDQWLQRLPVRIEFDRQRITFYNPRYFNPPREATENATLQASSFQFAKPVPGAEGAFPCAACL